MRPKVLKYVLCVCVWSPAAVVPFCVRWQIFMVPLWLPKRGSESTSSGCVLYILKHTHTHSHSSSILLSHLGVHPPSAVTLWWESAASLTPRTDFVFEAEGLRVLFWPSSTICWAAKYVVRIVLHENKTRTPLTTRPAEVFDGVLIISFGRCQVLCVWPPDETLLAPKHCGLFLRRRSTWGTRDD